MNDREYRIAMITEHGDPISPLGGQQSGGQNVYVYELAKALSALGVKVDVFTRWDNRQASQVVRFAKRAKVVRLKAGPRHFISKDKFGPLMPEFVERFLEYSRENKIKYDLIHTHYYYSGWAGLRLRNILKVPVVATFHSLGLLKKKALGEKDTSPTERTKIEKEIMEKADLIISTSPQEMLDMERVYGEKLENVEVISPGVNLRRFLPLNKKNARADLHLAAEKKIIVFAGKMEKRKGGLTLIDAVTRIKDQDSQLYKKLIVFMFTGDPRSTRKGEKQEASMRHELKAAIAALGKNSPVKLLPGVPQERLHLYYGAADVVVMPSYYEPFGMVAIEAMSSGTAVVASKVGGLQWIIEDGKNGFLAKAKSGDDFAAKIIKLLSDDKLITEMGKYSSQYARKNFGWPLIAKNVLKQYKKLISTNKEGDVRRAKT